jgi:antitoxin (DNA-binding transcriptional repressor) of toxin-antitoxin stability system
MSTITVQDIERDPLGFLRRLEAGEALLVVRGDRALAEVRPMLGAAAQPRPYGLGAGEFTVPDDFDRPLPDDILKEFEGP